MSLAVLVDVGLIAVDLDTVLGVLAVVAITVGAAKRVVAVLSHRVHGLFGEVTVIGY